MSKKPFIAIFAFMLIAVSNIYAAEPFEAPATFDFSESIVYLEAKVDLGILGVFDVDINPNPVPVDAKLYIETMDTAGNFTGYSEGTGATNANAPAVGNIPISGEAGGSTEGQIDFTNNKVTVYSNDAWAKVNVLGTNYDFDIDEGDIEGTFDGEYMRFVYNGAESINISGFSFNFSYDIEAIGKLETGPADSLTAFIDTNKADYASGDTFSCAIGIERNGPSITTDAWIVLINPANQLLFFPSFTSSVSNIPDLTLPADFAAYDVPIFSQTLPGTYPPIQNIGSYIIAIGLSEPGTTNFLTIGSNAFTYN